MSEMHDLLNISLFLAVLFLDGFFTCHQFWCMPKLRDILLGHITQYHSSGHCAVLMILWTSRKLRRDFKKRCWCNRMWHLYPWKLVQWKMKCENFKPSNTVNLFRSPKMLSFSGISFRKSLLFFTFDQRF